MASMENMLKQAQKLQEDMEASQKRLETEIIKVTSAGGAVTFAITGSQKFQECLLDPELLKQDKATIEEAILTAAREAVDTAKKLHEEEMKKITSGLNLPGMGGQ